MGMTKAQFRKAVGAARADELLALQPVVSGQQPLALPARWDLPMPPSLNKLWASITDNGTGRGKRVLTAKARDYRRAVQSVVQGRVDPAGLYSLRLVFFYPWYYKNGKLAKFDETNRIKLLEDCIAHALGVDDSHFKRPDPDSIDTSATDRAQAVRVYLMPLRASTEPQ